MSELWLIRHGETEWNRQRRVQGSVDIPLNEVGRQQAELLARRFEDEPCRIQALVSSDLIRSVETAQAVADVLTLPVELDAGLRERRYGIFEGLSFNDLALKYPSAAKAVRERCVHYNLEDGESLVSFQRRIMTTLEAIAARYPNQRVLVFTHSAVLDVVYRRLHGVALNHPERVTNPNVGINRIEVGPSGWAVLQWGDVSHLKPELV